MNTVSNKKLTQKSQALRKNMTKEERHLWYDFLKELPVTFHRQKVINNYIVDFYCASAKLVIELDGSQHYYDEVNHSFESVCQDIFDKLLSQGTIPSPSP